MAIKYLCDRCDVELSESEEGNEVFYSDEEASITRHLCDSCFNKFLEFMGSSREKNINSEVIEDVQTPDNPKPDNVWLERMGELRK